MASKSLRTSLSAQSLIGYAFSLCCDAERHALQGRCSESSLCYKAAHGILVCVLGQKDPIVTEVEAAQRAAKPPSCRTTHAAERLASLVDSQCLSFESSRIASALQYLAQAYSERQHFAQAVPLLELQLQLDEANYPGGGPTVAQTLERLALCYEQTGRGAEAERAKQRALAIWQDGIPTFS